MSQVYVVQFVEDSEDKFGYAKFTAGEFAGKHWTSHSTLEADEIWWMDELSPAKARCTRYNNIINRKKRTKGKVYARIMSIEMIFQNAIVI